jgi:hypothetical protein
MRDAENGVLLEDSVSDDPIRSAAELVHRFMCSRGITIGKRDFERCQGDGKMVMDYVEDEFGVRKFTEAERKRILDSGIELGLFEIIDDPDSASGNSRKLIRPIPKTSGELPSTDESQG